MTPRLPYSIVKNDATDLKRANESNNEANQYRYWPTSPITHAQCFNSRHFFYYIIAQDKKAATTTVTNILGHGSCSSQISCFTNAFFFKIKSTSRLFNFN